MGNIVFIVFYPERQRCYDAANITCQNFIPIWRFDFGGLKTSQMLNNRKLNQSPISKITDDSWK